MTFIPKGSDRWAFLGGCLGLFLCVFLAPGSKLEFAQAADWEETVQAAKKEGDLVVHGSGEVSFLFGEVFQRAYPDIKVTTVSPGRGSVRIQRIMAERRARLYTVDVYVGSPTDVYKTFIPAKVVEFIKPLLILPEVVDQSLWYQRKHHYADQEGKYMFMYEGTPQGGGIAYNKNLVNPMELKSFWDLLNPKWKGKIISVDPMLAGPAQQNLRFFYHNPQIGQKFISRLYSEMEVALSRDDRQILDWLGVGKYSFALFTRGTEDAIAQGLPIAEIPSGHFKEGAFVSSISGLVSYMNRAPHPHAAKVAVNWLLSRQAQMAFQKYFNGRRDSMREDISKEEVLPEFRRRKDVNYMMANRAEYIDMTPVHSLIRSALKKSPEK